MTEKEVLEMAMGMEEIGASFYEALALGSDNPDVRDFCLSAGREEARHRATLKRIYDQMVGSATSMRAPSAESSDHTDLAKEHIQPDRKGVHRVAIGGNLKEALSLALRMEQDAIRFYQGLIPSLPESATVIQAIVKEEQKHVRSLQALAASLNRIP